MPEDYDDPTATAAWKPWIIALVASQANGIVGIPLAMLVWYLGATEKYAKNTSAMFNLFGSDVGYLFLAMYLLVGAVNWVIYFPFAIKNSMKLQANMRANMYIYAMAGEDAMPNKIVLDEDGVIGKYNRASRSMQHMMENLITFLPCVLLGGVIAPFPVFVCCMLFGIGRFMHQTGYVQKYGKHGAGFGVSSVAAGIAQGLMFVVYLKSAGVM